MGRVITVTTALVFALGVGLAAQGPAGSDESREQQQAIATSDQTAVGAALDARASSASDARLLVKERMMALGLTASEADSKVNALTTGDLEKLANSLDQVAMAGVSDRTLIIIAVILIVPSVLLLLMI